MILSRTVEAEALDSLACDDPAAMLSRRDLRRIHRAMGTRSILRRALTDMMSHRHDRLPLHVLELGAGDGSLMLGVARALPPTFPPVDLTLLDAKALIDPATVQSYAGVGWSAHASVTDVFNWAHSDPGPLRKRGAQARWDIIVVNLFLHHFEGLELATLLSAIASRSDRFIACEPRRGWWPWAASHLVGALGANAVTRADAVLSVKAGFNGRELTALWPQIGKEWRLAESSAGLFTQCFRAERLGVK